ncbi:MAG: hypothetical protein J2O49_10240 [Sciscionella sp.]|nr:hypothetical protein [Sciscionella sp.]
MLTPITVNYEPVGDDWNISVVGGDKTLTDKAPGLIAARDRADQLVEKLTKDDNTPADHARTVVHLLDGDALAFTDAYLRARLGSPGQHRSDASASTTASAAASKPGKQATTPTPPTATTSTAAADPTAATANQSATPTGQRADDAKPPTQRAGTSLPTRKHADIPAPTKAETTQPNASVSNA